jgi:hypothetical protein
MDIKQPTMADYEKKLEVFWGNFLIFSLRS